MGAAIAIGEELTLTPREGVVLLNNGELIAGSIIAAGDRYDVHLPSGEISIKRSDVALVCRDAQECYQHKRAGIELGRAQDHLELAEWCIKNQLLEAAEKELAAARLADPAHPKIRLIESRLSLARQPIAGEPVAASAKKPSLQNSLDDMARYLPGGAMESFTNTIQPMLLNYCAKGGCHAGRAQGGLQLERIHPRLSGRSTTQRNLRRVLALVDRDNPPQSKLLLAPIRAHGPAAAPIFTDREQSQYKQLVQWVYAVAGAQAPKAAPTLAERTAPLLQAVPGASGPQAVEPQVPAEPQALPDEKSLPRKLPPRKAGDSQLPASSTKQAFTREQIRALGLADRAASKVKRGVDTTGDFVPKDPFDPEIFNRRFFGP
jgi:hypothetical protein